jgi:Amidase
MAPNLEPQIEAAVRGRAVRLPNTAPMARRFDPRSPTFATPPAVEDIALGLLAYNDVRYGGFTRNPCNLNERSSGSSAGSAAATGRATLRLLDRDGNARINNLAGPALDPARPIAPPWHVRTRGWISSRSRCPTCPTTR